MLSLIIYFGWTSLEVLIHVHVCGNRFLETDDPKITYMINVVD
jgi:hypothetical protein